MELIHCTPWIRFADNLHFVQQRGPSKTYDCRMLYTLKGEASLEMEGSVYHLRHALSPTRRAAEEHLVRLSL